MPAGGVCDVEPSAGSLLVYEYRDTSRLRRVITLRIIKTYHITVYTATLVLRPHLPRVQANACSERVYARLPALGTSHNSTCTLVSSVASHVGRAGARSASQLLWDPARAQ